MGNRFDELVSQITQIGLEHHRETILENSRRNRIHCLKSIRDVRHTDKACLVISAGPSLYRNGTLGRLRSSERRFDIVATDGAYIQCLKAGITPDWVVTIDPHPTRIVRWFGDPDWERNSEGDDYFNRQDLDVSFRENAQAENARNIELVEANKSSLAICVSAPRNVVERTSNFTRYWFAPLMDDPLSDGITKQVVEATGLPALNTGGTVGTCAWAYAKTVLQSSNIAVVGMDFGYPAGTPLKNTQEWNLTGGDPELYQDVPERGYYTSPTYFWYRSNFFDLLEASDSRVTNCSGAGLLYGDRVDEMSIEEWLKSSS